MKTNFLYFRENGYQEFTYASGAQTFTINGDANWDLDIGDSEEALIKVTVNGTTIATGGRSISGGVVTIAAASGSGADLVAGDVVIISLIPAEGTEACFRADRLMAVTSTSDTVTVLNFKASKGTGHVDTVTITHPDNDGAEFKLIADYIYEVCNANIAERGNVITCWDKQNNVVGRGLAKAGATKMLLAIVA